MDTAHPHERATALWSRAAGLFLAVECLALQKVHAARGLPGAALALIVAVDLTLFVGLSYVLLVRPRGGLRALGLRPRHALSGLLVALLVHRSVAGQLRVPALPVSAPLVLAAVELLILLLASLLFVRWLRVPARAEGPTFAAALAHVLGLFFPRSLATALGAELTILGAASRALRRVPLVARAGFGVLERSSYPKLALSLALLSLVEAPATHLVVHAFVHTHALAAHALLLVAHLYTLAWIVGDLRLLREARHVCDEHALQLELGARARASIPYADIAEVHGTVPANTPHLRITPLDSPNLVLVLRRPVVVTRLMGLTRKSACLALHVDDPEGLRAELARHT